MYRKCHFSIWIKRKVGLSQADSFICIGNLQNTLRVCVWDCAHLCMCKFRYLCNVYEWGVRVFEMCARKRALIVGSTAAPDHQSSRETIEKRRQPGSRVAQLSHSITPTTSGCTQPRINRIMSIRFSWFLTKQYTTN